MKKFLFFVFISMICTISYAISDTTEASLLDLLRIDTNSIKNAELSELYIKDSSLYLILDSVLLDNNDSLVFYDISFHQYSETTGDLVIQKSDDALYYLDIFYGYIYYKSNYFFVTAPRYIEYYNLIFEKSDNKKRFYMNWDEFELIDDSPEKMYRYEYKNTKFYTKNRELTELCIKDTFLYIILDSVLLDNTDSLVFYTISFLQYSDTTGDMVIYKNADVYDVLDVIYGYIYYKTSYFLVLKPIYIESFNLIFEKSKNKRRFYGDWKSKQISNTPPYRYKYEIKKNK